MNFGFGIDPHVVFDVYLVGAHLEPAELPALPAVPQHAMDGMRESFPFASYGLLEAFNLRTTLGRDDAHVRGRLEAKPQVEHLFHIGVDSEQATPDSISLSRVYLTFRVFPETTGVQESEISTQLSITESKTVVVGTAGVTGVADGVFLVLGGRLE